MGRLFVNATGISICSGVSALALPPPSFGLVTAWNDEELGAYEEFDLEMWATGARALTGVTLFGATMQDLVVADLTVASVNETTNIIAVTAHGLRTGDGPLFFTSTLTVPAPLVVGVGYYAIEGVDANHIKLASTRLLALAGTAIDLDDQGTGVITISDSADTERIHWHSHGLLGLESDGAITLDDQKSYMVKCRHRPRAFAYALTATFGAGAGLVSAKVYPSLER